MSEPQKEPFEQEVEQEEVWQEEDMPRKGLFVGKGFYAVLTICLVAVGGVAAATFADRLGADTPPTQTEPSAPTRVVPAPTRLTTVAPTRETAKPTAGSSVQPADAPTSPTQAKKEADATLFILPIGNEKLTPFSSEPVYNETMGDYRAHTGVDYKGESGQAVRAVAKGTVVEVVEDDPLWGHTLRIEHSGGIVSRYCGVTASVAKGDGVDVGDEIGRLSEIPCESAADTHLHVELYRGGQAVDPASLLGGQVASE